MATIQPVDSYRHQGLRKLLVQNIRLKGITDEQVLNALEKVPRHFFFDSSFLEYAYEDKPFPIGAGQTISQPYTVAFQTELLQIRKNDKVLEIGTGSGYQAALLAELGAEVYSVEIVAELAEHARATLAREGYDRVHVRIGDGHAGWTEQAPFDAIIVTCSPDEVPQNLIRQLREGGRMILPLHTAVQQLVIFSKQRHSLLREDDMLVRFVPMVKGISRK